MFERDEYKPKQNVRDYWTGKMLIIYLRQFTQNIEVKFRYLMRVFRSYLQFVS